MEIQNETAFEHSLTIGMGPDRRPCLTIIVKATFSLPVTAGARASLAPEQLPVSTADEYFDGDTTGSVRLESDAVSFKPRADIVLVGKAYAPGGRPVRVMDVSLRVGRLRKMIRVFGDRHWMFPTRVVMVPLISEPEPFLEMPLKYENAFGGFDRKAHRYFELNYVGKGFLGKKTRESVDGKPLPNLEDPHHLISSWDDEPPPAGFGFYSQHSPPRVRYVGTEKGYEQPHALFGLASDFKHDYFNGAHPDLQVPGYLRGDEDVELIGVTPDGQRRFRLPGLRPVVSIRSYDAVPITEGGEENVIDRPVGEPRRLEAPLDTLVFLPDEGIFFQVWRAVYPLGDIRDMENLERVLLNIAEVDIRLATNGTAAHAGWDNR